MKWNRCQKALIDLAKEPIDRFALDQIILNEDGPDLTTVIKDICNPKVEGNTRHVRIHARAPWDSLMTMCRAGKVIHGIGWQNSAVKALTALSGPEKRPVVLWLEELRLMKVNLREDLIFLLENVAWSEEIPLRIVMLVGKSRVWVNKDEKTGVWVGARVTKHVHSDKLDQFATDYTYDGKRIEETGDTPLFNANEHHKVQALRTA